MEEKIEVCVKVYVGCPEEDWRDFLYADLVVGERELNLADSRDSLEDLSSREFLTILDRVLREAKFYAKALNLKIKIDVDGIISAFGGDETQKEDLLALRRLIREFREEK